MKFYSHHIGDFDKATRHLTRIERSIYRDLLDLYYDTETQISLDLKAVCRLVLARSNEESTAVEQVLNEFFTETPTGWYHDRCEAEIASYHTNTSQKAVAGRASAEAKRLKKIQALNGESTDVQQPLKSVEAAGNGTPTNHKPVTTNHKPVTKGEKAQAPVLPGVSAELLADYMKVRKAKKAGELTQTAIDGLQREAEKAGITLAEAVTACCEFGWQGFNAGWYAERQVKPHARSPNAANDHKTTPGKHSGFSQLNYREGIELDGTFS